MNSIRTAAILLAASTILSTQALAADAAGEVTVTEEAISSAIEIAFGAAVTTRYVSRGVAQSDGVALQGYVEASYNIVYAGIWASTVDLAPDDVEIDFYAGIRPEFGALSLDIGYARYVYDATGDCCGEIYGKASYAFTDEFSGGVDLYWDPENETTYGALGTEIALPYDFTLSAGVGTFFDDEYDWNVGVSYTFEEVVTLDLRYHDKTDQPARFVATLSFDSSFGL